MPVQRYLVPVVIVMLVATGGCGDQTLTNPEVGADLPGSSSRQARPELPLRARLKGVAAVPANPDRCAPLFTAGNVTHGTMTHLGRVTGEHSQCIDPTGVLQDPLIFTNGQVTVTAANGDQLFLTFAGTLMPSDAPGVFNVNNPFQVVGGTGRFAGAAGGGTASGSLDVRVPETPLVLNLDGTLSLPR
jgi:hypothetical protein